MLAFSRVRDYIGGATRGTGGVVPARIMAPRIILLATATLLLLFGFLMIYSASSIVGLTTKACNYNPAFYLVRQIGFAAVGIVLSLGVAFIDYRSIGERWLKVIWALTVFLLILVYTPFASRDAYGASRWIAMGPFTLQPSEFAKVSIVLTAATIAEEYFERQSIDLSSAVKYMVVGVGLPLALTLFQPDKGTCGVVALTLLVMLYLSGVSGLKIMGATGIVVAGALAYALTDGYSRARIMAMLNPFADELDTGYQLVQGFYAFGSGGIFGRGLGLSRQKYSYLPMAHNDFIFAVIGEELGFVGCVVMIVAFVVLLWAGLKIAESAPDLKGRLIAAGSTSLLSIQLLLNLMGVVGIFPLSGKPIPFISYGGSSVISSCLLCALAVSVSMRSTLPETAHDRRRASLRIATERTAGMRGSYGVDDGLDEWGVGEAVPRTASRTRAATASPHLRVVEGGAQQARRVSTQEEGAVKTAALGHTREVRTAREAASYERLDIGRSGRDRLREARERTRRT